MQTATQTIVETEEKTRFVTRRMRMKLEMAYNEALEAHMMQRTALTRAKLAEAVKVLAEAEKAQLEYLKARVA